MSLWRKKKSKVAVEIFTKDDCSLCVDAKAVILKVQKRIPFELKETDIKNNRDLFEAFKEQIPVVFINGRKSFKFRVDEAALEKKLSRLV